jgi:outer membrane cobalamin receptor
MNADLTHLGAIAAVLLLVGCTAATVKPQAAAAARDDRACVTATRISSSEPCGSPGRVYSDKDIQNTGATTVAEALRLLDPSITVRR